MKATITNNEYGQKSISSVIKLKEDTVMLNNKNYGSSSFDLNWDPEAEITVPKGTEVQYRIDETRSGDIHTVSYKHNGKIFSSKKQLPSVVLENTFNGLTVTFSQYCDVKEIEKLCNFYDHNLQYIDDLVKYKRVDASNKSIIQELKDIGVRTCVNTNGTSL